jgi:hypothetical protein
MGTCPPISSRVVDLRVSLGSTEGFQVGAQEVIGPVEGGIEGVVLPPSCITYTSLGAAGARVRPKEFPVIRVPV